jgi:hypothetical protein
MALEEYSPLEANHRKRSGWRRWLATMSTAGEDWLGHRLAGWLLLGLVAGIYAAAYLHHPLLPDRSPAELRTGWWTWADQFVYWNAAAELAQFQLTAANYHYALGYPLLGALFMKLMPAHVFFVPDLLLVLGAAAVWWRLALRWLSRVQALVIGAGFVVAHHEVLGWTMVVPWNTLATQFTLLAGMWVMFATRGSRTVWQLSVLAGVTYLVRPGDAACFAPMLVWSVLRLPDWRGRFRGAAGGIMVIGATILAVRFLNRAVFDTWTTPYEDMTWQGVGFFSYPVAGKLFWIFVDGRPFFGETDPALFFRYPWLLLAVPAVLFAVRAEGMTAVAALATLGLNWWLYLNYNDFFPSGIYRYNLIHYLAWGLAPLFALSAAAVLHGWRHRVIRLGLAVAAGLAVLVSGLQMEPRTLPAVVSPGRADQLPAGRPLWISFPGVPLEKVTQLRLDGNPMQENRNYQIPYVPADLRLLLSTRSKGTAVVAPAETGITVTPTVGDFVWHWRFDAARVSQLRP